MKCFCRSDNGRIAIERPTGLGTYDYQCDNCHRYYRDGLVSKDQRIAFALKQIRGQTIVQPRFYGGATLRRSRQVRRAESFNAECGIQENSEGEWVCGWDADDNFCTGHHCEVCSISLCSPDCGDEYCSRTRSPATEELNECMLCAYPLAEGEEYDSDLDTWVKDGKKIQWKDGNTFSYGAESFGAESDRDDTEYLEAMQGIITNFEDSFCPSCSWGLDKHTIVNFNGMPFAYCEMGDNPYMNAESFGAEMDGKKLIASSYDLADGSMMVGVGTETLDVDDPDFMEMMIDEDGKIKYFTLPIGLDKWERSYRIKPAHYGKMKTQNETNEAVGGDFIRTDGEGKYAESFGAEFIKWSGEAEGPECFICGTLNPKGDFEGQDNTCDECDSQWTYDEYGEEGEGYYKSIEKTMTVKGLSDIIEMMMEDGKGDYSIIVAYHRNGDTVVSDIKSWSENGLNLQLNEEDFYDFVWGAESFASYDMPISERQRYRIRKLGGRIDKAMNRSDASRYIKSLMAVPLHAETADCPTCQGWGWNEELDIVCDADGCIGGWFIPKKPSLFQRGLESGLGVGAGIAGVALVMGLLGGSAGFAYEEMTKRRD